ncbi:MAG: sugar transferase [Candidatus Atribacteria bacterium]|nr:MAG: sugar transferase [Candidatus Atribacteria bacterium]
MLIAVFNPKYGHFTDSTVIATLEGRDRVVIFNRAALRKPSSIDSGKIGSLDPLGDEISYLVEIVTQPRKEISGFYVKVKRIFDIVFSVLAMLLLAPVLIFAAIIIKLESRGPVFYTQERIGIDKRRSERRASYNSGVEEERRNACDRRKNTHAGSPFFIYKLRTMCEQAENAGPELAKDNDPRITRAGKILRKVRIDEIPQFINVLKGEMSVIGPRPERSFFINRIKQEVPEFTLRHRVKPGITGLAQVEDGYTQTLDTMKRKLFYDLKYITQFSLAHEFRILLKTVMVVVTGKGAC